MIRETQTGQMTAAIVPVNSTYASFAPPKANHSAFESDRVLNLTHLHKLIFSPARLMVGHCCVFSWLVSCSHGSVFNINWFWPPSKIPKDSQV